MCKKKGDGGIELSSYTFLVNRLHVVKLLRSRWKLACVLGTSRGFSNIKNVFPDSFRFSRNPVFFRFLGYNFGYEHRTESQRTSLESWGLAESNEGRCDSVRPLEPEIQASKDDPDTPNFNIFWFPGFCTGKSVKTLSRAHFLTDFDEFFFGMSWGYLGSDGQVKVGRYYWKNHPSTISKSTFFGFIFVPMIIGDCCKKFSSI